jgi:SAM-dependent methyltransferase
LPSVCYTYDFVRRSLPSAAARVLEIGCGEGALAALLLADGLEVVAIDSDPQAVEAAQAAGVAARLSKWPAELGEQFDAVLFTRSLHHIARLDEAVGAADRALRPGGRIVVEDFRAEGGGEAGARWFSNLANSLLAAGSLTAETTLGALLEKIAPADHELHSSVAIAEALRGIGTAEATDAAYYFRYFEPHLRRPADAQELLDRELATIASELIEPLGKRFLVRRS